MLKIISLGGSIILSGNDFNVEFLRNFVSLAKEYVDMDVNNKLAIVTGGGRVAREYQNGFRIISNSDDYEEQDYIGIAATMLNAQFLKSLFKEYCMDDIVSNPNLSREFTGKIIVAGGWKPGFSTDYNAVKIAESYGVKYIVNLSNIKKVYDKDPLKFQDAKEVDTMKWDDYLKIIDDKWKPGLSTPFDPVASRKAQECDIRVIVADGLNVENTRKILFEQGNFYGTTLLN